MDLANKVVIITGGTHSFGAATAINLAKQGAKISLVARNIDSTPVKQELEKIGGQILLISTD